MNEYRDKPEGWQVAVVACMIGTGIFLMACFAAGVFR